MLALWWNGKQLLLRNMSGYENIVGGKLKLKGKALDVKGGGVKKKKKKHNYEIDSKTENQELTEGGSSGLSTDPTEVLTEAEKVGSEGQAPSVDDHLTPAERRYIEQRERINAIKLAKTSNKSHRDRIQDFNQYLANLSEHYDIPKVGPG
ncbi:protein FAM32A-like isoform X2 [Zingiber officinale]|uniref:protein FAM32A-like isoform X2 n=1 Tax=Zingiber officinale TaxID=94328 RepID=UPI001C4DA9DB|nr:protein FAM32A-like isoform X2 [Zingiber officinale]